MSEWRKVTDPSQVKNGQRIRYGCENTTEFGEDGQERLYLNGKGVNREGDDCSDKVFGKWKHIEALFDDASTIAPAKPPRVASTQPTHLGYAWDGVTYRDDHIVERTVAEHIEHIAAIRRTLDEANKQLRRYRTLEKRGLK